MTNKNVYRIITYAFSLCGITMQGIGLDIESILRLIAGNQNVSDLHLSAGESVALRLN